MYPENIDLSHPSYQKHLDSVFKIHQNMNKLSDSKLDYFMQSQILWDEIMAETASNFVKNNPEYTFIILAGIGHIKDRYGIPERITLPKDQISTIIQDTNVSDNAADFILYSAPLIGVGTPKIGAFLDTQTIGKIIITKVVNDSVAHKAGLQKDDQIVSLDNKKIESFSDLKLALMYADVSTPVTIEIIRDNKTIKQTLDLQSKPKPKRSYH